MIYANNQRDVVPFINDLKIIDIFKDKDKKKKVSVINFMNKVL